MGEKTEIGWTKHTFNPWWGCARVSPGCEHCYAEALAKRFGHDVWGNRADRRLFGEKHWREPLKWNETARISGAPALVFCASMADVFEDRPELLEERARLFELVVATPFLRWQLLTKRPENVLRMVPPTWVRDHDVDGRPWEPTMTEIFGAGWPPNAWIGTTVEDQQRADERIPELLKIPAPVRFLSCEPLLGKVWIPTEAMVPPARVCGRGGILTTPSSYSKMNAVLRDAGRRVGWRGIDWIIVGGESGPGHRPLDLDAARQLRRDADRHAIPFFFKQVGGHTPTAGGDLLDGERLKAFPPEATR